MNNIEISIVILEYNSIAEIQKCISSIEKSCKNISYEIIISSNSMYDKQLQSNILSCSKNNRWIFNNKNGGFAYGMNNGLEHAKGKYLIIINPDVEIISGLKEMILFMDSHNNIGAIAPQIIDIEGKIQDSCRNYITLQSFLIRQLKRLLTKNNLILSKCTDYSKTQTVDWVIGAFILVRKDIFINSRGLDDKYFMYCEDMDWCTRIRKIGFEIVYYPKTQIRYKGSRAARKKSKYAIIFIKSLFRYWSKFGYFKIKPQKEQIIYKD